MKTYFLLTALSSASALNIPALLESLGPAPITDPRFHNPVPAGSGDVRSPCPGLNTLANHGFLPHDGKNITIPDLLVGLAQGLNMGADFSTIIGAAALLAAPDPFAGAFDLDWLDQHNFPIEHDASLSRQDAYFGNDYSFYNPNWQMTLSYYDGYAETSINRTASARYARIQNSQKINPTFKYGPREFFASYGESALYIQAMSNALSNGVANVDFIKVLFENETLPVSLGWKPSSVPITLATLGAQIVQIFTALPTAVPEGLMVTANGYQDIFEAEIGGQEILANLTGGISNYIPALGGVL